MGEIYALSCAIIWGLAVILLKRAGESIGALALNVFRVFFSLPLIFLTLFFTDDPIFYPAPWRDYLILFASGILSIAMADTLFHKSLNLIGAGIIAIIDAAYAPLMVLLAFLMLGEKIGPSDYLGMGLIVGSVLLTTTMEPAPGRTRGDLVRGVILGLLALVFLCVGVIIAKPILDRTPLLWVTAMRQSGSALFMLPFLAFTPRGRRAVRQLRPGPAWRFMAPAAFLGSYLALIFWIAGMKYALVGVAAILTQSSTFFILLFAILFLREPLTRRKALAASLAIAGVIVVTLL